MTIAASVSWLYTNFFSSTGYFSKPGSYSDSKGNPQLTIVVVIYDEDDPTQTLPPTGDSVYATIIGLGSLNGTINAGETCGAYYSHYSITQLIEANWKLGNMGRPDDGSSANIASWGGGPICIDTIANSNTASTYPGSSVTTNNAKCSCSKVGNTC